MNHRIRIIMDEESKIKPDLENNYVIGEWDDDLESEIDRAMTHDRTILVIRPQGLELTPEEL